MIGIMTSSSDEDEEDDDEDDDSSSMGSISTLKLSITNGLSYIIMIIH